ncbi:T9SS type A sorting domain-containing protein [Chryseobacterium sp. KACC 21268]|nr:T9SS type A sorting domain-containing protein [Chryseobacterium sp. KACC 21268]
MKKLFFLLGASSFAFAQTATTEPKASSKDLINSNNVVSQDVSGTAKSSENQVTATYESKKLKKSQVYTSEGKLIQTSTKAILDEKKLKAGEYVIKVDFQDGTSTSAKFIKD